MQIIGLQRGRTRATIVPEAGGRVHQLEIYGGDTWVPLLVAPPKLAKLLDEPILWGSYVMAPWPGRIDGGRFLWRGRQYTVPRNIETHSIHGRGVYLPWRVEAEAAASCTLSVDFDDAWPFGGRATQHIELLDDGIKQRIEIESTGGDSFPAGAGWHPRFRRDVRPGADVRLLVDARRRYAVDEMIPTGWVPLVNDEFDLRGYPALGDRRIDACYRHPHALAIRWGDIELTMQSSPNVNHAVVYTPKRAVCIEAQTCAPDAFNLAEQGVPGAGMAVVTAREPLVAETTWRWRIR